ncbi:hypothetical protein NLX86_06730 [Streptomyces sp. A3M-1-3]|uniref:hypothetical protein n=1 Tax=Streptomyces sp. A3M-1-3 TaxID=2962044 RepID=UPI0020B66500|nr:hypothetical protein [Streptomyces sp. A3M-1-3]MCP3817842.1 hypothetical protein [Streptomyces sp. A3M-1-3]
MTPSESTQVAVELERLRGAVDTGFAEVKGSLALLVQRSDRTEADVKQLRQDTEDGLRDVRAEVEDLKGRKWPLPTIGLLIAGAAAAPGLIALLR